MPWKKAMPTEVKQKLKQSFKMSDKQIAEIEKKSKLTDVVAALDDKAKKDKQVMDALKECFG